MPPSKVRTCLRMRRPASRRAIRYSSALCHRPGIGHRLDRQACSGRKFAVPRGPSIAPAFCGSGSYPRPRSLDLTAVSGKPVALRSRIRSAPTTARLPAARRAEVRLRHATDNPQLESALRASGWLCGRRLLARPARSAQPEPKILRAAGRLLGQTTDCLRTSSPRLGCGAQDGLDGGLLSPPVRDTATAWPLPIRASPCAPTGSARRRSLRLPCRRRSAW